MCWGGFLFHLGDLIEFGGFSKWWGYWRVSEVNPSTIPSLLMIDRVKAQSRRTCVFHLGFKGLWIRSSLVESPAAHLLDHPTVPSSCSRAFQLASKTDGNDNKGRQTKSIQLTRKKQKKPYLTVGNIHGGCRESEVWKWRGCGGEECLLDFGRKWTDGLVYCSCDGNALKTAQVRCKPSTNSAISCTLRTVSISRAI